MNLLDTALIAETVLYAVRLLALVTSASACGALALVAWNALAWPKIAPRREEDQKWRAAVSVLVPARDEEENIVACLQTIVRQGATVREIIVYDDQSTDRTAQLVRAFAGVDDRVRLVAGGPVPTDWCGKTFACAQLASQARGDWLLFLDADARLRDGAVCAMLHAAERRRATLLSCWPGLDMQSFWERALMPMLNFAVLTLFPAPLALRRRDASLGLAHGACLLVERRAYERIGGHAVVRGELFEDTRLAREWRRAGEQGICLDGQDVVRVRMYRTRQDIRRGFTKNFRPAFRRERSFWLFWCYHALVFGLPWVLAPAFAWFWLPVVSVVAMRLLLALRFRQPIWSAFLHPLGQAALLAVGLASRRAWLRGDGVEWKGRIYRHGNGGRVSEASFTKGESFSPSGARQTNCRGEELSSR